jgi:hypothetical protein
LLFALDASESRRLRRKTPREKNEPVKPAATDSAAAVRPTGKKSDTASKPAISFNHIEYLFRWSENGQFEFTPPGQEDLEKWTDMVTINVYPDAVDGDGLALVANKVLTIYQSNNGKILKTDSVPRTAEKPAEHVIVAVLGNPALMECVQARFKLIDGKGYAIIFSHRVYGERVGDEMSSWLDKNGPATEKALMEYDPDFSKIPGLIKGDDNKSQ